MKKYIIRKENGIVSVEPYTSGAEKKENHGAHLCWENCSNACVNGCPKVADIKKRSIGNYPFIDKGFQVVKKTINEYGEAENFVDEFIVEECSHYKMDKPYNADKMKKLRRLKSAALRMQYTGAETLSEANRIIIEDALRTIKMIGDQNEAEGRPRYEGISKYIPAGYEDYFEEKYGIKNIPKTRVNK